ncbi:MAG: hypothetical protein KF903_00215 [Dokdonella sp.]|uniref:choice-of-anchor tandem repeat NxxGxxAF-containing protein n=1 Tax=Dokdonella sp. TaxID=2291710 RepID=UPI0025C1D8CB|nr:choice-of-anchor tandem repeat NxxGxxAF-containing protein [Dokdonella sp.]MBX3699419.1 hypothetical protein [Dokdonella sp.]
MPVSRWTFATLAALSLHALPLMAALPAWDQVELEARSNLIVNDNGWNVPPGTSFNSISANLNDAGQVTFTAGVVPIGGDLARTGAGIWLGGHGSGSFVSVHESTSADPDATMIISDRPGINLHGKLAYYTSDDGGPYVMRRYDPLTGQSTTVSLLPLTPTALANPNIGADRSIGFRGSFGSGYGIALAGFNPGVLYAVDRNVDAASPYAYLYSPATNDGQRIAVKVSTSDYNHNEIRLFRALNDSRLVVADQATDAASPFSKFDNGLALNNADAVAAVVTLAAGNVRAVYRFTPGASGYAASEIARVEPTGMVRAIDAFAPAINAAGLVVFRGADANGQAIFAGDGNGLVRVVGNGDAVTTDLGAGQLGQHDASPVFSGAPALNDFGDIAFVAGLHPAGNNQVEWGSGVFVAYAQRPPVLVDDTLLRDGFEDMTPHLYALDDGSGNTNQGPPSTFDPDMLWGNYFPVASSGALITRLQAAFGPTFPSLAHGPVTFWLLEDTDADGDPRNAHVLASVQAVPTVSGNTFHEVDIAPTFVQGALFVGVSAKLMGGQDKPARADTDNAGTRSWFFYAPDIASVIDDLAAAPFGAPNVPPNSPLGGAYMVRAVGIPGP